MAGVKLQDGVVGADEERDAKIEETLRRLGVKGANADEKQDTKKQPQVKKKRGGSQGSAMEDDGEFLSSLIEVSRGLTSWWIHAAVRMRPGAEGISKNLQHTKLLILLVSRSLRWSIFAFFPHGGEGRIT